MSGNGIARVGTAMPKDAREWERFLRRLNETIADEGERAVINALTTIATRSGTNLDSLLQMLTDEGRAEDQRFLPQVSAGNVLSLQNVNPLVASADATNATISVSAHTLRYGFGSVTYNSGTILGLQPQTTYFVYADDPNYAGGAVSYFATTVRQNVTASNGRYFVGAIETAISANTAAIVDATSTNPSVFETGTDHGWVTGDTVTLSELPGDFAALNGNDYEITVIDEIHFSIAVNATGFAAFTSGGLATRVSQELSGGAGGGGGWIDDPYYSSDGSGITP